MKVLIVNSSGHWINGWMVLPSNLKAVVGVLENAGIEVEAVEVNSLDELNSLLKEIPKDTLVWANAYWVNGDDGELHNLIKQIESYNLPLFGSCSDTLIKLIEKNTCQEILQEYHIPIPNHYIIENGDNSHLNKLLLDEKIVYPLVVKPTKESRSNGVVKVNNKSELSSVIKTLWSEYPDSHTIIEEFLPTQDITCGYIQLGNKAMLLPSYNVIKGLDCSTEIFGEEYYQSLAFYQKETLIEDTNILAQLEKQVPLIIEALNIGGFTRVDGRLDKNGTLKFFDINGMPGLNYPISVIIKQCCIHFPNHSEEYLFQCLINTLVSDNLHKNGLPIPVSMKKNHLFNLDSKTAIRLELSNVETNMIEEYTLI